VAGYAQTLIVGNVGKDPETKFLPSGVQVTTFSVAVTRKWTDRNTNEPKEKTVWYRVSCWRQLAEIANSYVKKGSQVMIVGQVEARGYTDNSGQPQATLELTADTMQLLGSRGDGQRQGGEQGGGDYSNYGGGNSGGGIDEIPF